MAFLINKTTNETLAQNVITAHKYFSRLKGLMGEKDFPMTNTLWLLPCKSGIHTFFMNFAIDIIYVNRSLAVTQIFKNIRPWRVVYPSLFSKSHSVFEFKTPALKDFHLKQGDQLHVGH